MSRELRCHACQAHRCLPYVWKVGAERNAWVSIWLVTRCCGALAHTEQVAMVCTYLHDGKANAELICKLMNEHNGVAPPKAVIDVVAEGDSPKLLQPK